MKSTHRRIPAPVIAEAVRVLQSVDEQDDVDLTRFVLRHAGLDRFAIEADYVEEDGTEHDDLTIIGSTGCLVVSYSDGVRR